MKHRFVALFLAFSFALTPFAAQAASASSTGTNRYFVQTTKAFWRNAMGARNVFDGGFTADLSDFQLRLAKLAGLKPLPLKTFNVLATETPSPTSSATPQATPAGAVSWGVKYLLGQENSTTGGKGVKVAVLDTGVDAAHPDLKNQITKCLDYSDSLKAFVDKECTDANGHGTHVAGIIAADGGPKGKGVWGLAPEADLLVYKVCNSEGLCYSDDIAKAIEGAVNDGANIIVLGMGGEAASSFVDDAISYAVDNDVLVIAAAGNNGPYDDSVDWPARNPATVSVGALASDGSVAEFSSRGINEDTNVYERNEGDIELVAPGENIESTFRDGSYAILSGTSMAAPHVAAFAARIWNSDVQHPADAARTLLHEMAKDVGPIGDGNGSGWGVPRF